MNVTVTMSPEEFVEYLAYREDKQKFSRVAAFATRDLKIFTDRLVSSVSPDPKKPGKYKIVDQEYMDDLWLLAVGTEEGKCEDP